MKNKYIPLDISARAYPMMQTRKTQSIYRFEVTLDKKVDAKILATSVKDVLPKYPHFKTTLVHGFYWYKLRPIDELVHVEEGDFRPFRALNKKQTNGYQFRFIVNDRLIAFEIFHAITDGNISIAFLSDVITRYLELAGEEGNFSLPERGLSCEDAFLRYARKMPLSRLNLKEYNGGSVLGLSSWYKYCPVPTLVSKAFPLSTLKQKAKDLGVSLSVYIATCYAAAILSSVTLPLKKPLALFVPANLRTFFPTDTAQNFVCFERIILPRGFASASIPEIAAEIGKQFVDKFTPIRMQRSINSLKRCYTIGIVRVTPLFIKKPLFTLFKTMLNKVRQTAIMSNVGKFALPESAASHVKSVALYPYYSKNTPLNFGIISFGDTCYVNFTSALSDTPIPDKFAELMLS